MSFSSPLRVRPSVDPLLIETAHGPVRGARHETRSGLVAVWRGIPYAAPPVGPLRFAAPRPPTPWREPLDATVFGPLSPQPKSLISRLSFSTEPVPIPPVTLGDPTGPGAARGSLTLNVYAPTVETSAASVGRRPVIVFLHGGAFYAGGGAQYDGSRLAAAGGVVVVTCNYRLGALGWISFQELARAEGSGASQDQVVDNRGLRDQIAALRWVRDHIAAFGGDPDAVTLVGESAGASSVLCLLASPRARGLVHRAVVQSPPEGILSPDRARDLGERYLRILGARSVARLAERPTAELTAPQRRYIVEATRATRRLGAFGPRWGDEVLPEPPLEAIARGDAAGVPLIVGVTRDEATLFVGLRKFLSLDEPLIRRMLAARAEENHRESHRESHGDDGAHDAVEALLAAYPRFPRRDGVVRLFGDALFGAQAVRLAEAQSRHAPVWRYRFDYASPSLRLARLGAMHGIELPFVFDQLDAPTARRLLRGAWPPTVRSLGERLRRAWLAFARGDFGHLEAHWPRYRAAAATSGDDRAVRLFDRRDRIVHDLDGDLRRAWRAFDHRA